MVRLTINKNGDIDMKSLMEPWQGNYDIDWWPRKHEKDGDDDISILSSDVDKTPCPSLSELQLHKTMSREKSMT